MNKKNGQFRFALCVTLVLLLLLERTVDAFVLLPTNNGGGLDSLLIHHRLPTARYATVHSTHEATIRAAKATAQRNELSREEKLEQIAFIAKTGFSNLELHFELHSRDIPIANAIFANDDKFGNFIDEMAFTYARALLDNVPKLVDEHMTPEEYYRRQEEEEKEIESIQEEIQAQYNNNGQEEEMIQQGGRRRMTSIETIKDGDDTKQSVRPARSQRYIDFDDDDVEIITEEDLKNAKPLGARHLSDLDNQSEGMSQRAEDLKRAVAESLMEEILMRADNNPRLLKMIEHIVKDPSRFDEYMENPEMLELVQAMSQFLKEGDQQ